VGRCSGRRVDSSYIGIPILSAFSVLDLCDLKCEKIRKDKITPCHDLNECLGTSNLERNG